MYDSLQAIVDALAEQLGRSVAIDDPTLHLLAYSAHVGPVDPLRVTSILTKQVSGDVAAWVLGHNIAEATVPVRVPPNPDYELMSRIAVPIRRDEQLIGFLWLIDPDGSVTEAELEAAGTAAIDAAVVMHRDELLRDIRQARERELVRDVLSDAANIRRHAADSLVEAEFIASDGPYVCAVVMPGGDPLSAEKRITSSLESARQRLPRGQMMHLARHDHGVAVVAIGSGTRPPVNLGELGAQFMSALQPAAEGAVVGIGDHQPELADVRTSYLQALHCTRLAGSVAGIGPVVMWSKLGIYRLLAQLPMDEVSEEILPPGLTRLLSARTGDVLVRTLETYLDRAGDAAATAAALNVHRVSLYGRLKRIEEIAAVDLGDGEQRLWLHLGIKLARMAGLLQRPEDRQTLRV